MARPAWRNVEELVVPNSDTTIPLLRYDKTHVNKLARVIDNADGEWPDSFGAIEVDQDDLIIKGVHRYSAAAKRGLKKVRVQTTTYDDAEARLLAAISDNAEHGKGWTPKDESELIIVCERFGVENGKIAQALRIPVGVVERKPVLPIVRRGPKGEASVVGKVYVPRPVRNAMKNRDQVTESEAELMESFVTPHSVGIHMAEIVRLSELFALPPLTVELYALAREAMARLDEWVQRDQHLLNEVA